MSTDYAAALQLFVEKILAKSQELFDEALVVDLNKKLADQGLGERFEIVRKKAKPVEEPTLAQKQHHHDSVPNTRLRTRTGSLIPDHLLARAQAAREKTINEQAWVCHCGNSSSCRPGHCVNVPA